VFYIFASLVPSNIQVSLTHLLRFDETDIKYVPSLLGLGLILEKITVPTCDFTHSHTVSYHVMLVKALLTKKEKDGIISHFSLLDVYRIIFSY